jgi:glycosyltransferase involved in cell wall biosynthesis
VNLSVVIIAKNEEVNIRRCLEALQWCDDLLVVDDFSEDRTREIAESLGARVFQNRFRSFASQRNWAMDNGSLRHDWVLMLDADEVVPESLKQEMQLALQNVARDVAGFLICRKTMFMGRWLRYSDGFPVWIMRLVRPDNVRFVDAGHGEVPAPKVAGRLEQLYHPLTHYPFSKGLSDWVDRHNRYSTLESQFELAEPSSLSFSEVFSSNQATRRTGLRALSRRLPFRAFWRFCFHYFWKAGFLDGRAGWSFASLMAVYEGLIVLKRREEEMQRLARKEEAGRRVSLVTTFLRPDPLAGDLRRAPAVRRSTPPSES